MTGLAINSDGRLPQNITYFCKALRRAGVPIGTAQVLDAIRAVQAVGFTARADFFTTLQACLVTRPEHLTVFGQVFRMFWRDPEFLQTMMSTMLPMIQAETEEKPLKPAENRAAEAMAQRVANEMPEAEREELELDAQFSFSANEQLKQMDFEAMTLAEIDDAKRALRTFDLPVPKFLSRRKIPTTSGSVIDAKATFRAARKRGGEVLTLPKKRPRAQPPNLVIICDVSGSMSTYSRMMMHFIHSVSLKRGVGWAQVQAFTIGTQLTNVTRSLSVKDPDAALTAVGKTVRDWDGGTLIGAGLEAFNKIWSRRVLGGASVILLVTDGLEREATDRLAQQMDRLHKSCRHLIWLNPLLRWDGFEPQAAGIRAILPHVDAFASCHSLGSLTELSQVLSQGLPAQKQKMMALL